MIQRVIGDTGRTRRTALLEGCWLGSALLLSVACSSDATGSEDVDSGMPDADAARDGATDAPSQMQDAGRNEPADAQQDELSGPGELRAGADVQPLHDVTSIKYTVLVSGSECDGEPLEEFEGPAAMRLSFSHHRSTLEPGQYVVCATPLASGEPSEHCESMRQSGQVYSQSVTEQIFRIPCEPVTHPETKQRYAVTSPAIGFHDASAKAQAMGGYLAVVNSEQEHLFLMEHFEGRAWIGLADPELDGTFEWINGEPVEFTAWCEGEPNQLGPEYWAEWSFRSNGCWNDVGVGGPRKGLVEIDAE